jgi:septal ring factor EnvC (AmiA/AmiB activator)
MAEPTLKDVLRAIAELRTETKGDIAQVRSEMATKADLTKLDGKVDKVEAKVDAHRAETKQGFGELDKELAGHADVHREIETDIEALKRRPARTAARAPRRTPKR